MKSGSRNVDVSIIIVNWNAAELLQKCLQSILLHVKALRYEIIVADNASVDHSVALVRNSFPDVLLIQNSENLGFAIANNRALKLASGKFVLFLNPDTEFIEEFDSKIFSLFEDESVGVVGCKLLNSDFTLQASAARFPSPLVSLFGWHALRFAKQANSPVSVDWIMGAFMILRYTTAEELSGFDDRYFMYSEDMDLCFRLKRQGKKTIYYPEFSIVHHYNQSGKLFWNNRRDRAVRDSLIFFVTSNFYGFNKIATVASIRFRFFIKNSLETIRARFQEIA